jgi:hypothetical protein
VLIATGKVSQLIRLSREQFVQPETSDQLSRLILLSPTAWAEFRKLKVGGPATNSSLIGGGHD